VLQNYCKEFYSALRREGIVAQGTIYESSGSFYVRYSVGMTVSKNGKPRPIQKSHRLCEKNDKYYSSKALEVKLLRHGFMALARTSLLRDTARSLAG
jgi:hypothetical protein